MKTRIQFSQLLSRSCKSLGLLLAVLVWLGAPRAQGAAGPAIINQPQSTAAVWGGRAVFTVVASGTPTPACQWRKNGVAIPGETSSGLALANVQFTHAGNYTVVVSNSVGALTSSVAVLTVTSPKGGDVDFSFDAGSAVNNTVRALAVQGDGKVLVGGTFTIVNGVTRSRMARFNSDGSTDYAFLNGLAGANNTVYAVVPQSDGKVLVAGDFTTINGVARNRIARLHSNGSLDNTFQNGLDGANSAVWSVAVQSDDKVLLGGGFTTVNGVTQSYIARLNSDGSLDTTFLNGLDGANSAVNSVALQSDGKVLLGGTFTTVNGVACSRVARLNSDGSLDTTFQNGLAGANNGVNSVAVQSDGKVLLGGDFTTVNGVDRIRVARLNSDGSLDPAFQNGLTGANLSVVSVAAQGDGKVLLSGNFTLVNGTGRFRMARLNNDGSLDTSFLNGLAAANSYVYSFAVQGDGKVLVGGNFTTFNGAKRNFIARLASDGSLDAAYQNGTAGLSSGVNSLAVQNDGRVVLGGAFNTINGVTRNLIGRLTSDGSLDTTFQNGMSGANNYIWSVAVAVQGDGKVLIGGQFTTVNGVARNRIARLNTDGSLDTSFQNGMTGVGGTSPTVYSIALQSDGKVLLAGGFATVNGVARNSLARLNSDGSLDADFQNGLAGANNGVSSLAVQSDGKVLVGGNFTTINGVTRKSIARMNADGTLDTSFQNGLAGANSGVNSVAVQADGKVLLGGYFTSVNGVTRNFIARLNSDGTLDTTFQNGSTGADNYIYSVIAQADGRVLLGGNFTLVNGVARNSIARLNGDGSLDTTFQNGLAGANNYIYSLALQSDGRVLVGGNFTTVNGVARSYVARLWNSTANADLNSLLLGAGTLSPAFQPGSVAYSISAPLATSTLKVTPTSEDPAATIRVRANSDSFTIVPSGSASSPLPLHVGTNTVDVQVTSADGAVTKTYTVTLRVLDTTPPALTCPATVNVNSDSGQCYASGVALGTPTASDNFGTVTVTNNAPAQYSLGTSLVTWTAFDPSGNTNTCVQLVIVTNRAPTAANIPAFTSKGRPLVLEVDRLLSLASDPEGDLLTMNAVSATSTNGGSVVWNAGQITYTPFPNFTGADRFGYTISDGCGRTASAEVVVTVSASTGQSANITYFDVVGTNFVVRFAGIPGVTYTVEATDTVNPTNWIKKDNRTAPITNQGLGVSIFEFSESAEGVTQRYYRTVYPSY